MMYSNLAKSRDFGFHAVLMFIFEISSELQKKSEDMHGRIGECRGRAFRLLFRVNPWKAHALLQVFLIRRGKRPGQAHVKPKHRLVKNQVPAHQSRKQDKDGKFLKNLFPFTDEKDGVISNEGRNKDRDEASYVTMCMKTSSGKTISIGIDRRQGAEKIREEVEKRTQIPKDLLFIANEGKALTEKQTVEECNTREGATIDVSLRLQGGAKGEEMKTSAGSTEERQVRIITLESHSEISGVEDMKLGDVTDLIRREIENASKRSDERIEICSRKI